MLHRHLSLLFFLCVSACAQQKKEEPHLSVRGEPQFVIHISLSTLNVSGAAARSCIIVYPDSRFRFEKNVRSVAGGVVRSNMVAAGTLTDSETAEVKKLIQDADIAMLDDAAVRRQGYPFKKELKAVYAAIPRSNTRTQSIAKVSVDGEALAPAAARLVSVLESVEARGLRPTPDLQPNNCREPRAATPVPSN